MYLNLLGTFQEVSALCVEVWDNKGRTLPRHGVDFRAKLSCFF